MVKCPKCKAEIDWFKAYSERVYSFDIDDKGNGAYELRDDINVCTSFECPECDEELFKSEGEATNFLKGVKE